ncbi:MAG: hypothetical protein CM1200mP20_00570 [Pseudomonadota bacterium]|nr:MAG: hypothetical protein CM1200mP20_00570 [Pseudomonadota bacterium]
MARLGDSAAVVTQNLRKPGNSRSLSRNLSDPNHPCRVVVGGTDGLPLCWTTRFWGLTPTGAYQQNWTRPDSGSPGGPHAELDIYRLNIHLRSLTCAGRCTRALVMKPIEVTVNQRRHRKSLSHDIACSFSAR